MDAVIGWGLNVGKFCSFVDIFPFLWYTVGERT